MSMAESAAAFGNFLTWMQEKDAPVFVVATANDGSCPGAHAEDASTTSSSTSPMFMSGFRSWRFTFASVTATRTPSTSHRWRRRRIASRALSSNRWWSPHCSRLLRRPELPSRISSRRQGTPFLAVTMDDHIGSSGVGATSARRASTDRHGSTSSSTGKKSSRGNRSQRR